MTLVGSDDGNEEGRQVVVSSLSGRLRATLKETTQLLIDFERNLDKSECTMDTYIKCCRQLIAYMATHMNTSGNFVEQMENVIKASFSSRRDVELRSLVTGCIWAQYNGSFVVEPEVQSAPVPSTPSICNPSIKTNVDVDGAVTVTPLAAVNASISKTRPSCSPHIDLTVTTSPIAGRRSKRQLQRAKFAPFRSKRARHTVARNLYGAGTLNCDEKEEASELESTNESEIEIEEEETELQVHVEPLLPCERVEKIAGVCAIDGLSKGFPASQKRLRAAIKLIDALNCCPPLGMVCTQGCSSLRVQMCETHRTLGGSAKPCHDGSCRIWLEIDTHFVRCQDSQCDFKNLVGLRQTKYDIQQHELKLKATRKKIVTIKDAMRGNDDSDDATSQNGCDNQLDRKIKKLEEKCTKLEDVIVLHKDRERAFVGDLNTLQMRSLINGLPDIQVHYVGFRQE